MTNDGGWQESSLTPTITNGQKVETITSAGSNGCFRLRGPCV